VAANTELSDDGKNVTGQWKENDKQYDCSCACKKGWTGEYSTAQNKRDDSKLKIQIDSKMARLVFLYGVKWHSTAYFCMV
jgi:hypothetical protein